MSRYRNDNFPDAIESLLFIGPLVAIKPAWLWIGWPAVPLLLAVGFLLAGMWAYLMHRMKLR